MGWGDEIIASGEARRLHKRTGKRVGIYDRKNKIRWSPVWENNPIIIKPHERQQSHVRLINAGGARLYLDYERMFSEYREVFPSEKYTTRRLHQKTPYRFNDWKSARGELHFVKRGNPKYVIIEPMFKPIQKNRNWGFNNWQKVVNLCPDVPWLQINPKGSPRLYGVHHIPAQNFMDACRCMANAIMYVGTEGGLYHAAGAMFIPSVAIFGGFVSPHNQGYEESINLYDPEGSPCGQRLPCRHCQKILQNIRPQTVAAHVMDLYNAHLSRLQKR
jgi:ADP-heptose:LPS heptosyltransferase